MTDLIVNEERGTDKQSEDCGKDHTVRIHINRKPYHSASPTNGDHLYALGEIREGRELFREEQGDHEDSPVHRGHERIDLREDDHFFSEREHRRLVTIEVNTIAHEIHRGDRTVVQIKEVGKVPLADDLDQIVEGKLVPLPDEGSVKIKGGEKFVSHPKDSGSSNH